MADRTLEEWAAELRRMARTTLPKQLRAEGIRAALDAERKAKAKIGGSPLHTRTGLLRRSTHGTVEPGETVVVRLENTAKYAITHEKGMTIRPKRSRYLAIPLDAAKTKRGVPRWASPRDVPDAFVVRTGGSLLIARRLAGGQLEALFALVRQVTVPRRPFIRPSLEEAAKVMAGRLAAAVKRAALEAQRG